jgi:hypothetical protein
VEVVPSRNETTAVGFHYDAPGNAAPHSMVLAVPPANVGAWSESVVEAMLGEALAIAKLRAVHPEALQRVGHFLPAAFLAHNENADTVSLDLSRLVVT